jgi:hypothetical protein
LSIRNHLAGGLNQRQMFVRWPTGINWLAQDEMFYQLTSDNSSDKGKN